MNIMTMDKRRIGGKFIDRFKEDKKWNLIDKNSKIVKSNDCPNCLSSKTKQINRINKLIVEMECEACGTIFQKESE